MSTTPAQRAEVIEPLLLEVKAAANRVELSLAIPHDLIYFRGHFPDFAILPGVVQIEWVMGYAKRYFPVENASAGTLRIKFRRPILPGDRLLLTLDYRPLRTQLDFTYAGPEGIASSGRIGLECL
jgi:3-hydroxymyristoyl/3-hydroxydecanoyl-(acyl carrier protein) dehydratase